jgi:hypothetical protein
MTPKGEIYLVELRAVPGDVPGIIRLRRFLKAALRSYQLVAGDVRQLPGATAPVAVGPGFERPPHPPIGSRLVNSRRTDQQRNTVACTGDTGGRQGSTAENAVFVGDGRRSDLV